MKKCERNILTSYSKEDISTFVSWSLILTLSSSFVRWSRWDTMLLFISLRHLLLHFSKFNSFESERLSSSNSAIYKIICEYFNNFYKEGSNLTENDQIFMSENEKEADMSAEISLIYREFELSGIRIIECLLYLYIRI